MQWPTLNSLIWASVNIENTLLVYRWVLDLTRFFVFVLAIVEITTTMQKSSKQPKPMKADLEKNTNS